MDKESKGFIKLDRAIFDHWIFQDADKFKAFIDLIQLMRWKDETLVIGNDVVEVPRGSFYTSELKLSERWMWSRKKVRAYLTLLEKEGMLNKKGTTKGTMLTIANYSIYQGEGTTKGTSKEQQRDSEGTSKEHQKNNEGYTKEEIKEINKNREEGKEREEEIPVLPHLPKLDGFRKFFLDQYGEIAYRTWLEPCEVKETDKSVSIQVLDSFRKTCIESKFKNSSGLLYKKKVEVIEKGG